MPYLLCAPMRNHNLKACLCIVLFLFFVSSVAGADESGVIQSVNGSVMVKRAGEDSWVLAAKSMIIRTQDTVATSVDSRVQIAVDSTMKNILRVGPDTEIVFMDLVAKKIFLPQGEVLSLIEELPAGSLFEIRTPTAVAGVAGTGLAVYAAADKTDVKCFEATVYVKGINPDGSVMAEREIIAEGYKREISRFKRPGMLLTLSDAEIDYWTHFVKNVRKRAQDSIDKSVKRYEDHPDLKDLFK